MAISYPEGLPLAQRDGYAFTPTNNITRTEMQSGRARQRIEFENTPHMLNLVWTLTAPQAALFQTWARRVVGAGWFTMTILTPLGFDDVKMRFTQTVSGPELVGRYHWIFRATVEIEELPMLDPDAVLFPDYVLHPEIFDIAMNSLWPLNPWQRYADAADKAINEDWPTP